MRVFQLCAGAATGGAEMAYIDTCRALQAAGIEIIPVCRPHKNMVEQLRAGGMEPVTLPFGGWADFKTGPALRRLILERQPDIIQTWMNRAAKFVPTRRDSLPPFTCVARLGGYYKLKYYKAADHFVANTPAIRDYLIEKGVPATRVTQINNFADIDDTYPPVDRAMLDTKETDFVFLTLARLHPVKGIDLFIRALASMPADCIGWIAGDGPERDNLQTLAHQLGVSHRLRFLGWRDDRMALLKAVNALVFPSRFEPFGNSFAQAWGASCPLITTASQGPLQYVRNGLDALVSPIDDMDSLVQSMQTLYEQPALGQTLAAEGKKRFAEEFTREACVARYMDLYRQVTI